MHNSTAASFILSLCTSRTKVNVLLFVKAVTYILTFTFLPSVICT